MQRSTERILTSHCGSLARPKDLLDMMKAKVNGEPYDPDTYARRVRSAVAETVRQQVESGIDVPSDGEQGKPGFFTYVSERLTGFAPKPDARMTLFAAEVAAFPEYYKEYFSQAILGGAVAPMVPPGVHRAGQLSGTGGSAQRHRQPQSRPRRDEARGRLYARLSAERRRPE